MNVNLIVILGPTASGKTTLAVHLAKDLGAEIISADSRQIYRGMDLGTGKDLSEYCVGGVVIPYHLIDVVDPNTGFSVFDYQQRFFNCFAEISSRGVLPILVGGSGLYLESVLKGYRMCAVPEDQTLRNELATESMESLVRRFLSLQPRPHNRSDLLERSRLIRAIEIAEHSHPDSALPAVPRIEALIVGVRWERRILRERITERLRQRLAAGMIEEVRALQAPASAGKGSAISGWNIATSGFTFRGPWIIKPCSRRSTRRFISMPRARRPGSGAWKEKERSFTGSTALMPFPSEV
jgi:tRNA dimethylallyltransferase